MHHRALHIAVILILTIGTETHDTKTRFLLPRANGIVLWSPYNSPVVSAQWYIARHADNRAYVVTCRGACHWTAGPDSMDGDRHEAIMPRQPVKVALDAPGEALFTLSVFGPGGKLRETAEARIKVCGGDETPCG
jgi:hypothetical protein